MNAVAFEVACLLCLTYITGMAPVVFPATEYMAREPRTEDETADEIVERRRKAARRICLGLVWPVSLPLLAVWWLGRALFRAAREVYLALRGR